MNPDSTIGTSPAAATTPVRAALPVVCSTNQGIATSAATLPDIETAFAASRATSGPRRRAGRPVSEVTSVPSVAAGSTCTMRRTGSAPGTGGRRFVPLDHLDELLAHLLGLLVGEFHQPVAHVRRGHPFLRPVRRVGEPALGGLGVALGDAGDQGARHGRALRRVEEGGRLPGHAGVRRSPPPLAPVSGQFRRLDDEPVRRERAQVVADEGGALTHRCTEGRGGRRTVDAQRSEQLQAERVRERPHLSEFGEFEQPLGRHMRKDTCERTLSQVRTCPLGLLTGGSTRV